MILVCFLIFFCDTTAPIRITPPLTAFFSIRVVASPYSLLYTLTDNDRPPIRDSQELAELTRVYLEGFVRQKADSNVFRVLDDFLTVIFRTSFTD